MARKNEEQRISAVDIVKNGIIQSIIEGKLKPGGQIPTEPELAKTYDVGRNSVREAIKQLQAFGILNIRRADGTYVAEQSSNKMLDPLLYSLILQNRDWKDFVQLREVIEIGVLHEAMADDGIRDIVPALEGYIADMQEAARKAPPNIDGILEKDLAFHLAVTDAIHNPLVTTVYEYITRISVPSRRISIEKWIADQNMDLFLDLHRRIVRTIEEGDQASIERVIRAHYVYWRRPQGEDGRRKDTSFASERDNNEKNHDLCGTGIRCRCGHQSAYHRGGCEAML